MVLIALADVWEIQGRIDSPTQRLARDAFKRSRTTLATAGLRFKHTRNDVWSVRVGIGYRALCPRSGDEGIWFWIGTREEYGRLIGLLVASQGLTSRLRKPQGTVEVARGASQVALRGTILALH